MNCTNAQKSWTIYDAKLDKFLYLSHEEFKSILDYGAVKLTSKFIPVNNKEKIWIDGILNSDWFK